MAEQQTSTWGSMIWGATKVVGLVTATALVLPVAMNALGTLLGPTAGTAASGFIEKAGEALSSGASGLSNLNSTVVGAVFGEGAVRGINFTSFSGLGDLAGRAGTGIVDGVTAAGKAIGNNPGTAAAVAAGGLAVGYMIRGAEQPRRPALRTSQSGTGRGFVEAEMARRQAAALAAQQGRA
jgi:hypothetical protein